MVRSTVVSARGQEHCRQHQNTSNNPDLTFDLTFLSLYTQLVLFQLFDSNRAFMLPRRASSKANLQMETEAKKPISALKARLKLLPGLVVPRMPIWTRPFHQYSTITSLDTISTCSSCSSQAQRVLNVVNNDRKIQARLSNLPDKESEMRRDIPVLSSVLEHGQTVRWTIQKQVCHCHFR